MGAMTSPAVAARDLGKTYKVYSNPWERVLEAVIRRPRHRAFVALSGVSFDLPRGEGLGVIGQNGAGKSTLLKILAGIVAPSDGSLNVEGKTAAILELGSGFHPEFTGRQNIRLNAAMLGLSGRELEAKLPAIIEFSELGAFIDQPVKTYSTGMAMRLGFAIATQVEPDVLIIDEALSVGDGYFQKKCMDHLQAFLGEGGTLLFCSHAMYYVSAFCQRALWLRHGEVAGFGPAEEVIRDYELFLQRKEAARALDGDAAPDTAMPADPDADDPARRPARIDRVACQVGSTRPDGEQEGPLRAAPGEALEIAIEWETSDPDLPFHLGVGLNRSDGVEVASFSTFHDDLAPWRGASRYGTRLVLPELPLVKGQYTLYLFLLDEAGLHIHDQRILPDLFRIAGTGYQFGIVRIEHRWEETEPAGRPRAVPSAASSGA